MNASLELHHVLVRKLLNRHAGFESATEGDSFITAFFTPLDALSFAQVRCCCLPAAEQEVMARNLLNGKGAPLSLASFSRLQALQAELLHVKWPAELLACPLAGPVWAEVSRRVCC